MKITNKNNFPLPLVRFAESTLRRPTEGRIGVNALCDSPQINYLLRKHWDELEVDVEDRLWALNSTAIHSGLQAHGGGNALSEEKMLLNINGTTISGISNLYEEPGIISDWKFVKTGVLYFDAIEKYEAALNIYAYMFEQHGFPVKRLQNVFIFRNWDYRQAEKNLDYPQKEMMVFPQPLWLSEKRVNFIGAAVSVSSCAAHAGAAARQAKRT